MEKEIADPAEVRAFIETLTAENKYVINILQRTSDDVYIISWQEHKMYTGQDGIEYPDEVWVTIDYRTILVQDLEVEHCRNVLRMLLRQRRETGAVLAQLAESLRTVAEDVEAEEVSDNVNRVLH
jgi:hypothetical protein